MLLGARTADSVNKNNGLFGGLGGESPTTWGVVHRNRRRVRPLESRCPCSLIYARLL